MKNSLQNSFAACVAALALVLLATFAQSAGAQEGKTDTELLLQAELSELWSDENGWTQLHWAAAAKDGDAARRLLAMGVPPNIMDKNDNSEFSDQGKGRFKLLGQEKDWWKNYGYTPLHMAALFNSPVVASILIANGADIHAKTNYGATPLHAAAFENALAVVKLLTERGAHIWAKDNGGRTPLHESANGNAPWAAKMLIERGAHIQAKTNDGYTPLHSAAFENASAAAKLLIERGAHIQAQGKDGLTPMDFAILQEHDEMQSLLRQHGGRCNREC